MYYTCALIQPAEPAIDKYTINLSGCVSFIKPLPLDACSLDKIWSEGSLEKFMCVEMRLQ